MHRTVLWDEIKTSGPLDTEFDPNRCSTVEKNKHVDGRANGNDGFMVPKADKKEAVGTAGLRNRMKKRTTRATSFANNRKKKK